MEYFVLGICSRTEAESRGYFTTVFVTVNAPPEKNPDIVSSNCSSFLVSFDIVVGDNSVATADAADAVGGDAGDGDAGDGDAGVAFAGRDAVATRTAADNDKKDDRDIPRFILS